MVANETMMWRGRKVIMRKDLSAMWHKVAVTWKGSGEAAEVADRAYRGWQHGGGMADMKDGVGDLSVVMW